MMIRILCLSVLVLLFCTDIEATTKRSSGLKCYFCLGRYCRKQITCPHGQICMSASVIGQFKPGQWKKYNYRSCTSPSYCPEVGKKDTLSISLGTHTIVANVMCCNSNLCNGRLYASPKLPSGNGLKCLFCDNIKYSRTCRKKECIGKQTQCVRMYRSRFHQSGCATDNFCRADKILGRYRQARGFAGTLRFPAICYDPKPHPTTVLPTTTLPPFVTPTTTLPTTTLPPFVLPTTTLPPFVLPTTTLPTTAAPTTAAPTTAAPTQCVETTPNPTCLGNNP